MLQVAVHKPLLKLEKKIRIKRMTSLVRFF
jgi:hypothetical protein